jgi:hypothetical protein
MIRKLGSWVSPVLPALGVRQWFPCLRKPAKALGSGPTCRSFAFAYFPLAFRVGYQLEECENVESDPGRPLFASAPDAMRIVRLLLSRDHGFPKRAIEFYAAEALRMIERLRSSR